MSFPWAVTENMEETAVSQTLHRSYLLLLFTQFRTNAENKQIPPYKCISIINLALTTNFQGNNQLKIVSTYHPFFR